MNFSNPDDLIKALKQGDENAFVHVLTTYNKPLFAYAISLTHDTAMAQDVLQNVFLKTWEKRQKINISTSLQNYLYRAVYNEFINQYKKNKATFLIEQKYHEALEKVVIKDEELPFENIIKQVTSEIDNLPPKCKEVFILSRKEGLTNIEIADYLNISIKSVEAHIKKAFSTLKKNMTTKYKSILFFVFPFKTK